MSESVKNGIAVFEGASAPFFLAFFRAIFQEKVQENVGCNSFTSTGQFFD